MKNNNFEDFYTYDERQKQISGKSSSIALIFALIAISAVGIYKAIAYGEGGLEFLIVFATVCVKLISDRLLGNVEIPKGFYGRPLPIGKTKDDKLSRIKYYLLDGVITGIVFVLLDIVFIASSSAKDDIALTKQLFPSLGTTETVIVTAVISFIVMFAVSFAVDYIIGEIGVKRYNKMLSELDDDNYDVK